MHVPPWTDWRHKSPIRGTALVFFALFLAFRFSNFPSNRATLWQLLPTSISIIGMLDTVRCMQKHWTWYHGGVLLCIYMDLMAVTMILFFLVYPYW